MNEEILRNAYIFGLIIGFVFGLLMGFAVNQAFADSQIHIDNTRIGKELTVSILTYNMTMNRYTLISEQVDVEIQRNNNTISSDSCMTYKRNGFCAVAFPLTDGKYESGQYNILVKIKDEIKRFKIYLHEVGY